MKMIWLVWERADWQGDSLWGAYATEELADAVVAGRANWFTEEIDVYDTPDKRSLSSWHGN